MILVVVNPSAGREKPVLAPLNRAFRRRGAAWDVAITHERGDARRIARKAVEDGVDVVAACGGDGLVSEVAAGVVGSAAALAVLPAGTGNVVAQELEIPLDLESAAELACRADELSRDLDVLRVGEGLAIQRCGIGADARVVATATRDDKNRMGWLAYLSNAFAELQQPTTAEYRLSLDGRQWSGTALTCVVSNIGRFGRGGFSIAQGISPFDGIMDVIVVRDAELASLAAVGASVLGLGREPEETADEAVTDGGVDADDDAEGAFPDAPFLHLRGAELEIEVDPVQPVHTDGETAGETPLSVRVERGALRVVLPGESP